MNKQETDELSREILKEAALGAAFFKNASDVMSVDKRELREQIPDIVARCATHANEVMTGDLSQFINILSASDDLPDGLRSLIIAKGLQTLQKELQKTLVMSVVGTYLYLEQPDLIPAEEEIVKMVEDVLKGRK